MPLRERKPSGHEVPKVRIEPWGAWARLAGHGLVAIDREARDRLFPEYTTTPGPLPQVLDAQTSRPAFEIIDARAASSPLPLEVHLAVTGRCATGCSGCYLDATPDGREPTFDELVSALDAIADAGAFVVAFGGGEPTLRHDLGALALMAKARGLSPVVTTSGLGLSPEKRARLASFDGVNVSLDGIGAAYKEVRGFDRSSEALASIRDLSALGVSVGVNVVLTKSTLSSLDETLNEAANHGARRAQLLRYKPAGRAATRLDYLARRLDAAAVRTFPELLRGLVRRHGPRLSIRLDCAMLPYLSEDPDLVRPERAADLVKLGVLGCEAGRHLAAITSRGNVAPCSFLTDTELRGEHLMRRHTAPHVPSEPCSSCPLSSACRGGCRAVSAFLGTDGPDPECPRVERRSRSGPP